MHKTVLVLWMLIAVALSALPGCGGDTATTIPDSVSADQVQQLEASQQQVEAEEMQQRVANP